MEPSVSCVLKKKSKGSFSSSLMAMWCGQVHNSLFLFFSFGPFFLSFDKEFPVFMCISSHTYPKSSCEARELTRRKKHMQPNLDAVTKRDTHQTMLLWWLECQWPTCKMVYSSICKWTKLASKYFKNRHYATKCFASLKDTDMQEENLEWIVKHGGILYMSRSFSSKIAEDGGKNW